MKSHVGSSQHFFKEITVFFIAGWDPFVEFFSIEKFLGRQNQLQVCSKNIQDCKTACGRILLPTGFRKWFIRTFMEECGADPPVMQCLHRKVRPERLFFSHWQKQTMSFVLFTLCELQSVPNDLCFWKHRVYGLRLPSSYTWANYLSRGHTKMWFSKGITPEYP